MLLLLLVACSEDAGRPAGDSTACPAATPADTEIRVPGMLVPPGFVALKSRPTGQRLTRVNGYIEMTPLEVFAFYKQIEKERGYEFFLLENEIFEAEAFFSDGKHRNYVTARTACPGRSNMFVFVAPEDYSKSP